MINYSDKTLDKKQQKILAKYPLIKFKEDIKINKIEDVFDNLFNKGIETYDLNNKFHCGKNKGRSYYDCFLLSKYYLPNITFKEMYRKLYSLVEDQNPKHKDHQYFWGNKPGFFTCYTIGKTRFNGKLKL